MKEDKISIFNQARRYELRRINHANPSFPGKIEKKKEGKNVLQEKRISLYGQQPHEGDGMNARMENNIKKEKKKTKK